MKKVYAIIYEELYSDGSYSSGLSYVFDSLEKAKKMLQEIKNDEIEEYIDNGTYTKEEIKKYVLDEDSMSIMFDLTDEYTKYEIIEMGVQ